LVDPKSSSVTLFAFDARATKRSAAELVWRASEWRFVIDTAERMLRVGAELLVVLVGPG
jgi:hypothetical protein